MPCGEKKECNVECKRKKRECGEKKECNVFQCTFFSPHGTDVPRIVIAKLTEQFQGKRKM